MCAGKFPLSSSGSMYFRAPFVMMVSPCSLTIQSLTPRSPANFMNSSRVSVAGFQFLRIVLHPDDSPLLSSRMETTSGVYTELEPERKFFVG